MRKSYLRCALSAAAMLAGVAAAPVQAAIVNTWSYQVTSSFTNSVFESGSGVTDPGSTRISWGPEDGVRSAIGVNSTPTSGNIDTNGAFRPSDDYYHENFALPLGTASLLRTTLNINIALTPIDPAGNAASPIQTTFAINFFETPNTPSNNVCANGGTVGSGVNGAGCADIFTLAFSAGEFDFTYDDVDYTLFLFEDPTAPSFPQLGTLSDAACATAGVPSGCFGFLTPEGQRTLAEFVIEIDAQDVPEPGMFGMLGLGVLGIAAARRRRKAN